MKRFPFIYLLILFFCCAARLQAAPTNQDAISLNEAAIIEKAATVEMKELVKKVRKNGKVQVIVEFKESLEPKDLAKFNQKQGGKKPSVFSLIKFQEKELMNEVPVKYKDSIKHYDNLPYMAMSVTEDELKKLRKSGRVKDIYEDRIYRRTFTNAPIVIPLPRSTRPFPPDPDRFPVAGSHPSTEVVTSIPDPDQPPENLVDFILLTGYVENTRAWKSGYSGKGQSIVVIDSGVARNNPSFQNRVIREACFSSRIDSNSISGGQINTSLCRGGKTKDFRKGAANVDCRVGDVGCAHGTYAALLAAGNNGAGDFISFVENVDSDSKIIAGAGIAPEANIIAIKAESNFNQPADCAPATPPCQAFVSSDLVRSLDYVLGLPRRLHVAAVNMSLGGTAVNCFRNPLRGAIRKLRKRKIATVVSSGNEGDPFNISDPACIPESIAVGATKLELTVDGENEEKTFFITRTISEFSNSARKLDLLAPGEDLTVLNFSVDPTQAGPIQGTSFSAPLVAGAWASLKYHKPSATVDEILRALQSGGRPMLDSRNATIRTEILIDGAHRALDLNSAFP